MYYFTRFILPLLLLYVGRVHAERPNILWITAEDMSPTLGCYADAYAHTPHIDALAAESVRFTRAFATAPICSPSRSCLITGCYATSLGTHHLRSVFPIPSFISGFPAYLRKAGYYTTNNVKTDYNTSNEQRIIEASWDDCSTQAHWRNRRGSSQPFFSVFNLMTSHQTRSMVWPRAEFEKQVQSRLSADEVHDPAAAPLPPYYPDTPVIRRTVARYYDCVTVMDKEVGAILQQLDEDKLVDDTIIFFYSDHGSGLPRHKRCLQDSGMHVPLLIRFPAKWRHLMPTEAGETTDQLVSFVDFGPTVLSIANVEIPDYMQGSPFLGNAKAEPREYAFGHRDRVDEVIDMARSVRTKRYLYIRNFMPHLGWNQPSAWPDQGEIRHEFYRLAAREKMTDAEWQFVRPTRPVEELYDCDADPHNLNNLAAEASEQLELMRDVLRDHLQRTADLGIVPEIEQWSLAGDDSPWTAARTDLGLARHLKNGVDVAWNVGFQPSASLATPSHRQSPTSRYWGALGQAAAHELSDHTRAALVEALEDDAVAVRIAAADALGRHGHTERALPVLVAALEEDNLTVVLYAARTIELMGDAAAAAIPAMRAALERAEEIFPPDAPPASGKQDLAMFIGFSTRAFLTRVAESPSHLH